MTTTTKTTANAVIPAANTTVDAKVLKRNIAAIAKRTGKLQDDIHHLAKDVALHAYHHNDHSMLQVLVDGLGAGVRAAALVKWFGMVGFNHKGGKFMPCEKKKFEAGWANAVATPWFKIKTESTFGGYDLKENLIKLARAAVQQQKQLGKRTPEEAAKVKLDEELLNQLVALAGGMSAVLPPKKKGE